MCIERSQKDTVPSQTGHRNRRNPGSSRNHTYVSERRLRRARSTPPVVEALHAEHNGDDQTGTQGSPFTTKRARPLMTEQYKQQKALQQAHLWEAHPAAGVPLRLARHAKATRHSSRLPTSRLPSDSRAM